MKLRAPSPTPLPGALPKPVLRRSTHVWNGLDLMMRAEPTEPTEPMELTEPGTIDITDADFAHAAELMKMLDEEIEIASTSIDAPQAHEPPPPALEAPPPPVRVPLQRLHNKDNVY